MKCVCIYHYGGPEVLSFTEAPRPRCGPGEVLVQVHAAGVNPVDWKIREGHLAGMLAHTFPLMLGWDVSGVVGSTGPGTTRLKIGDEVFSRPDILRDGAYAEFIVIRESEVALKPRSLDHVHAAALPLAGLAAWQSLVEAAQLASGQRVLIHAAAGGVGSLAVQLAKARGAHVIGTASARNHDFLRDLGVDEIIDYEHMRFEDLAPAMDVVLDTIGGDTQERSWKTLKRGGILVSLASPPSAETAAKLGLRQAFVFVQPQAGQLAALAELVEAGKLKSIVGTVLPLAEATRAHALSQGGHTRGKIVLQIDPTP
jgi:NADPH:quinone reductase-like Zn-dependent oxidoreductase